MSNAKLVWSDDPRDKKCAGCGEYLSQCTCVKEESADKKFVAVFRLENKGRGGKTVTVIDKLPKNENYIKELAKELKNKCGTGGTHLLTDTCGVIEIQGDKREAIKAIFDKKAIKYKGM